MSEALANSIIDPTTTLSSSITNVSSSLPVAAPTSPDAWPTDGSFVVRIELELIRVTAATSSATSLTVVERGTEGTTAASHASAVAVDMVMSKGALERYFLQSVGLQMYVMAR